MNCVGRGAFHPSRKADQPKYYGNDAQSRHYGASTCDTPSIAVNKYYVATDNDGPDCKYQMDAFVHLQILAFFFV